MASLVSTDMSAPSAPSAGSEIDRGFSFAGRTYKLVHDYGPSDFTVSEKEAMASALVGFAIDWVRSVNLSKASA